MSAISSTSTTSASYTTASTSYTTNSSEIDWSALVEASVQAKLERADSVDLRITKNETKVAAYETMQSLLQDIAVAAQNLRAASGSSGQEDNIFLDRAAYLSSNGSVTVDDTLSVTVEHGAQLGSFEIDVISLAKAHKVASAIQSARSEELDLTGVISLGVEGAEATNIAIDADMTLDEIAEAINAEADTTGVQASVIRVAAGQYQLIVSAVDTGKAIAATAVSGDNILAELGILDANGEFDNELQAAQDAVIEIDGIEVTRDSNDIDDVVDGVSLHLYATTPEDDSITVDIGTNLSNVKTAIQSLVDAYNAYREFAYQQQGMTSAGEVAEDAVLFGEGALRNANSGLSGALNLMIGEASIAKLGLSFDNTNYLEIDEDALDSALLNDLDAVKSLLTFEMSSSSSDLMLLSRGTSTPSAFSLDISVDSGGNIVAAAVAGDNSLFTVSGNRIIGKSGTDFEGFTFVFTGSASTSIDISMTAGIAERLYHLADAASNTASGSLATIVENLEQQNDRLQTQSDNIRSRAETYRTTLTERYASYQAAIAEAESTKQYLEALLEAQSD